MSIDNNLILENSKNLNILYVEDDKFLSKATSALFLNYFKKVDIAKDGLEGLDKYKLFLQDTKTTYDIVITDINMPNMNGVDFSKKIKKINNEQIIIIITAFDEAEYLHASIELGVSAFLTKPLNVEQLRRVVHTTSQIANDRKIIQHYYEHIDEVKSISLGLKDISQDLENSKEKISMIWMGKQIVQDKLESHTIDVEFFRTHYGIKVIEYFLNVVRGNEKSGNCPVIFIMLDFFKNKNLPLEDIFMICVNFKNTLTSYVLDSYNFSHQLFEEMSLILDENFEGVIINYLKLQKRSVQIPTIKKEEVIYKEESIDTNYVEYVIDSDIYELQDLEDDIDALAVSVTMGSVLKIQDCEMLGNKINRYGSILSNYPLFKNLGESIVKLGVNLTSNAQLLFEDKDRLSNITALVEGFVNDLIIWRKEIFDNNIKDPHFLDNSFFSNVDTIIMFIEYDENTAVEDDGDMEFF